METTNALEELSSAFATQERNELKIEGLGARLFAAPLNLEDNMTLLAIHEEKDATQKASAMARFLVKRVETEDGNKAFKNCHNKTAVEVLRTMVDPKLVLSLFSEVASAGLEDDAEELLGKSDSQDAD